MGLGVFWTVDVLLYNPQHVPFPCG